MNNALRWWRNAARSAIFAVLYLSFFFATLSSLSSFAAHVGDAPKPKTGAKNSKKSPKRVRSTSRPLIQGMGEDIRKFGEEVANRIDRIVKEKSFDLWGDPWTMQGLPILFPSPTNGFNLGFRIQLQNIRRQDPHQFEVAAQLLGSDRGRYKHQLSIDAPRAFGGAYRFTGRAYYDRDISYRYFGIGNETPVLEKEFKDFWDPYYRNLRAAPSITLQMLRCFGSKWRAGPIVGFKWSHITYPPGGFLDLTQPVGLAGGRTHYLGLAIIHDELDFEPYPSRGGYHELYLYWHSHFAGSDYNYARATYTYRRFIPLHRRLIFGHRFLLEHLQGNVPYFEMGVVGGSNPSLGIGGDRYIRGFEPNRVLDKTRLFIGHELRWDPLFFDLSRLDLTIGFVPFLDFGRVWGDTFSFGKGLGTWYASAGWGLRLIINSRLIVRGDLALTRDGPNFVVEIGNGF